MDNRNEIERDAVKHMSEETKEDLNADPITGEPGSHPVGTAVGSAGGALAGAALGTAAAGASAVAAGAALGTAAGPLGTLIGGALGAIIGGGVGHAAAEAIDPTIEEEYWRAEYANTDYYKQGTDFDRDYHPAYAVGYANRHRYPADARFDDHEADLHTSWEEVKGDSSLTWDEARPATRAAWDRVTTNHVKK